MVVTDDPHEPGSTALPEEASRLLERARQLAEEMNHPLVGTEHLLVVVLEQPEVEEWGPLKSRGVRASAVRAKLFGG
jgi:hypothetical protein